MKENDVEGTGRRISCGGGFEGQRRKSVLVAFGALLVLLLLCTSVSADEVTSSQPEDHLVDGGGVGTDGGGVGTDGGGVGTDGSYDGGGVGTDGGGVGTD
jgi:hypothetical protein